MAEVPTVKRLAEEGVLARTTTSPSKWIRLYKLEKNETAQKLNLRIHNTTSTEGVVSIVVTNNNVVGGPIAPKDDHAILPIIPAADIYLVIGIEEFLEFETPIEAKGLVEHFELALNPGWSVYVCSDIRNVNFQLSNI